MQGWITFVLDATTRTMHGRPTDVAKETLRVVQKGEFSVDGRKVKLGRARLSLATRKAVMYQDGRNLDSKPSDAVPCVYLFRGDAFEAAGWSSKLNSESSVVVLDFASDSEPGGGYRGNQQGTQEESLCRRSNLGFGLEALGDAFPIPTYGAAFVPEVCVFRGREDAGYPFLSEPFWIGGVIAASLRCVSSDNQLDKKQASFVRAKIDGVLAIAKHHGHRTLVLGPWGCGAFGNSARCVAELFSDAIQGPYGRGLDTIVFAFLRPDKFSDFAAVFNDALVVDARTANLRNFSASDGDLALGTSEHGNTEEARCAR